MTYWVVLQLKSIILKDPVVDPDLRSRMSILLVEGKGITMVTGLKSLILKRVIPDPGSESVKNTFSTII